MRYFFQILIFCSLFNSSCSQAQDNKTQYCVDPQFNALVAEYINFEIPVISVAAIKSNPEHYIFLDAREPEEYKVSHIEGALNIGYNRPDYSVLQNIPKDKAIVIYCSIGYRSEKIGKQIKALGYSHVSNLYGSIFEWVNQKNPVVDASGPTMKIHAYNKKWGNWISNKQMSLTY